MTKDEAMKLALEALECTEYPQDHYEAITAIKEALAQPEQEPVAVVSGYYGGQCVILPIDPARIFNSNTPLYSNPPAQRTWVGLTDEEIVLIVADCASSHQHMDIQFAKAIEAKIKEKNSNL